MDPITFMLIEAEVFKVCQGTQATSDDYKDAIVEVFADTIHLTDPDIDRMYADFCDYKAEQQTLGGSSVDTLRNFFK